MAEKHTNDLPQYYLIKDSKAQELISKATIGVAPAPPTAVEYTLTTTNYICVSSTSIEYEVA